MLTYNVPFSLYFPTTEKNPSRRTLANSCFLSLFWNIWSIIFINQQFFCCDWCHFHLSSHHKRIISFYGRTDSFRSFYQNVDALQFAIPTFASNQRYWLRSGRLRFMKSVPIGGGIRSTTLDFRARRRIISDALLNSQPCPDPFHLFIHFHFHESSFYFL